MTLTKLHLVSVICLVSLLFSCNGKKNDTKHKISDAETQEQLVEVNRILVQKDIQKINGYIQRKGWKMNESATGFWYEIFENCQGDSAKTDMIATISYTISLLDGTVCYNSDNDGLKTFRIGKGNVESGLEQGILMMCRGNRARFIFPPHLAWGLPGDGKKIPARSTILYEIELLTLTNSN